MTDLHNDFQLESDLEPWRFMWIGAFAATDSIDGSYVNRILQLVYLSPTIVEAILAGRHQPQLTAKDLLKPFPMDWREQENNLLATQKLL